MDKAVAESPLGAPGKVKNTVLCLLQIVFAAQTSLQQRGFC
jgi:hypothetical protein